MKRNAVHFLIRKKLNKLISKPLEFELSKVKSPVLLQIPPLGHAAKLLEKQSKNCINQSFEVKPFEHCPEYNRLFCKSARIRGIRSFTSVLGRRWLEAINCSKPPPSKYHWTIVAGPTLCGVTKKRHHHRNHPRHHPSRRHRLVRHPHPIHHRHHRFQYQTMESNCRHP